jgi:hypothetical protein
MMSRPLLISDCDEVLLHMMKHFGEWLASEYAIDFVPQPEDFSKSMRYRNSGEPVAKEQIWLLLDGFFKTEMHRQTLVPHALEALRRIDEVADIVILTNLGDEFHASRVAQLDAVGIRHHVVCNLGGKGPAVARLIADRTPPQAVFVDDIPGHHASVAEHVPEIWRLHMVADPDIARLIPNAPAAHKRIDDWAEAVGWILDRLTRR